MITANLKHACSSWDSWTKIDSLCQLQIWVNLFLILSLFKCFFDLNPHFYIPECNGNSGKLHFLSQSHISWWVTQSLPEPSILCKENSHPYLSAWKKISKKILKDKDFYSSTNIVPGTSYNWINNCYMKINEYNHKYNIVLLRIYWSFSTHLTKRKQKQGVYLV